MSCVAAQDARGTERQRRDERERPPGGLENGLRAFRQA